MLIQAEKPTKYIVEKVKSFLLPHQRADAPGAGGDRGEKDDIKLAS
jgi:hypothetical protein